MQENRDYENYVQRISKRGQKALTQFESYIDAQLNESQQRFPKIIEYFIFTSNLPTLNVIQKSAIIQIFERIIYIVHDHHSLNQYIPQIVGSILQFFNDPSDKVRFSAISTIYNVFKFLDDDCLVVFTRTFKQLPCIITDPSADVRQAAAHLNHTMKTLLNNAILDHYDFDYEDFINILTQNFLHTHPVIKQFLIDWINTIDQIKQFQSTKYLPLFLKKLFLFLVDENRNVRIKAQECLNGFIQAFKLSFTCSKQQITKRYKQQQTQNILILLIRIIEESIVFEGASDIDIHVFTWLDSFCSFLIQEINQGLQPFLSRIIINIFQPLFDVMTQALSIDQQNVRQKVVNIHENLLIAYPFLYNHEPQIEKAAMSFDKSLVNCRSITKTEIIIKWVNRMADNNNEYIHNKIDIYIQFLVEKMCEFNSKNLVTLFDLLESSIFTSQYFSVLIHSLLLELDIKRTPNQIGILSHIVSLTNSDYNFILLCSEIIELNKKKFTKFKIRLSQILMGFLITQKSLADFRENIKKMKISTKIFRTLAAALVQSRAAYVVLCLLIRDYQTAVHILQTIGQEGLQLGFMHSLFKASNLLMHPAMHQLYIDMGCQQEIAGTARRAYLSILMYLPINRTTSPLLQKAKQLVTDEEQIGFVYLRHRQQPSKTQAYALYCQRYLNGPKVQSKQSMTE